MKNDEVYLKQIRDAVEKIQVFTAGMSKDDFLGELCAQKAGLPRTCWKDPQTKLFVFTADVFSENESHE